MKLGKHHSEAYAAQCYVSIGAYNFSVLRQNRRVLSARRSLVVLQKDWALHSWCYVIPQRLSRRIVSLRRSSLSWYRYCATMCVNSTGGCSIHTDLQCECWYVMSYSRYDGRSRRGIFVRYWYYASLPPLDGVVFTTCGTSPLVRGLEV